jgi:hypothetical protein
MPSLVNHQIGGIPVIAYGLIAITTGIIAYATVSSENADKSANKTSNSSSSSSEESSKPKEESSPKTEESVPTSNPSPLSTLSTLSSPSPLSTPAPNLEETKGGKRQQKRKTPKSKKGGNKTRYATKHRK